MKIIFAATLFFLILIILELVYSLFARSESRAVNQVVERYSSGLEEDDEIDILYYRRFSDIRLLNTIL